MLRLLHRKEVERLTSLTRSTIYASMGAGTFPKAVKIGPMRVGWVESEVLEWLKACVAARDAAKPKPTPTGWPSERE
jgi:prophage regulatory protein